jgi:hypothetical protein
MQDLAGIIAAIQSERPRIVVIDGAAELSDCLPGLDKRRWLAELREVSRSLGTSVIVCGDWDFARNEAVGLGTVSVPQILLKPVPPTAGPWGLFHVIRSDRLNRRASEPAVVVQVDDHGVSFMPDIGEQFEMN